MMKKQTFDASNQPVEYILGIDLGTSGIRACIVSRTPKSTNLKRPTPVAKTASPLSQKEGFNDAPLSKSGSTALPSVTRDKVVYQACVSFSTEAHSAAFNTQDTSEGKHKKPSPRTIWQRTLEKLLLDCQANFPLNKITCIIGDATSSTVYLADSAGAPISPVLMYYHQQAHAQAEWIANASEEDSQTAAKGASSTLAKVLYLYQQLTDTSLATTNKKLSTIKIVHQIDWLNNFFTQGLSSTTNYLTDENNALKLGYNPVTGNYPNWVHRLLSQYAPQIILPNVKPAGEKLSNVCPSTCERFGFSEKCAVYLGTTDSIAGFLASGASQVGDSVTSLGSTIAIKQLVQTPIFSPIQGLYSHKLKNNWLLGGASNGGGKVLLDYYSIAEIEYLDLFCQQAYEFFHSPQGLPKPQATATDFQRPTNAQLWAKLKQAFTELGDNDNLTTEGERFPVNNEKLTGRLDPLPEISAKPLKKQLPRFQNSTSQDADYIDFYEFKERLQQSEDHHPNVQHLTAHIIFFNSVIQGLVLIEKQAYECMKQLNPASGELYAVGGGTQNQYWQRLRQQYLSKPIKLPWSQEASYGVTRLVSSTHPLYHSQMT